MRLVVDTNVFVSAALKNASFPASVVRWIDRHGGLLKSQATERQLLDVLCNIYRLRHPQPCRGTGAAAPSGVAAVESGRENAGCRGCCLHDFFAILIPPTAWIVETLNATVDAEVNALAADMRRSLPASPS